MEPASLILKRRAGKVSDYPICRREPKNWARNLRFELPQIVAPAFLFAWRRSDKTVSQLRLRGRGFLATSIPARWKKWKIGRMED
jgi:hypothetical protein